ncbi:MAG: cation diffusion facilitator family transporter [Eubacteriales bacterium]
MDQQTTYKKQSQLSSFQFFTEIMNFIIIAASAIMSGSLIVWMDLINSAGNTLRTGLMARFSRKMTKDVHFQYNYGIGKAEAMLSLFCDCFVFIGLITTFVFSILEIISPKEQSQLLIYVIGIKVICVICDTPMVYFQYKIKKANNNRVANSGLIASIGSLLFDAAALVSLIIVWLTRGTVISQYLSPIFAMLIAIYLIITCVKHMYESISELTDKTLPEEEQMKILKSITKHQHKFDEFRNVKTRYNGTSVCIDLCIGFADETDYRHIKELRDEMQKDLSEVIENCVVTIVIE